ncbi:LysR family transcriptional regulator [Aliidongia dinghuensis]|uniref:LysR family transcriptional regulator n=1 Tax=Aliidongia dinghuensis TaxID=1867774 RepID=A0A8J2YSY1_9PROT|nr:LysR family transcriptional regulator [Aliidongia dinghuensis]GGF17342.1 LysR family transcriptional regulator [Aliidongia dinghuensis]
MPSPSLRQFRIFLAAIETGSVTAAARALNVTQPAASQQLRELEKILGTRLLVRAGGRVAPTTAGAALVGPAGRVQAAVDEAVAVVAAHRAGDTGRIRLGTGATACIYLLPPVLAAVKRRMPGLEIIIATGNSEDMLERLEAGDLDVALATMPGSVGRSLAATRVLEDPMVALVPESLAPAAPVLTPADLAALPLILYEPGGTTRSVIDGWFRQGGIRARPIMELGSIEAIKMLVGSGLGASVMPALALPEPIAGTVVRPLAPAASRDVGYVLRRSQVMDRGLRLFVEELGRAVPVSLARPTSSGPASAPPS